MFSDDFKGGSGDPANDYAVMTGPFRKGEFVVAFTDADDVDSIFVDVDTDPNTVPYLTRAFGMAPGWVPSLPSSSNVQTSLNVSTYDSEPWDCTTDTTTSFRNSLEGWRGKGGNFCDAATKNMDAKSDGSGLRSRLHNIVHLYIGGVFPAGNPAGLAAGSMAQNTSPNDPVF